MIFFFTEVANIYRYVNISVGIFNTFDGQVINDSGPDRPSKYAWPAGGFR